MLWIAHYKKAKNIKKRRKIMETRPNPQLFYEFHGLVLSLNLFLNLRNPHFVAFISILA